MKPNPEQDADRAAFDAWYSKEFSHVWHSQIGPEDSSHYESQFDCWQAAKAESRARNTLPLNGGIRQVAEPSDSAPLDSTSRESLPNSCERCAAPFRKTGGVSMAKLKPIIKVPREHTQLVRQLSSIEHQMYVCGLQKTAAIIRKAINQIGKEIEEATP